MDKFNRIFQASLGNKLTKLEEADNALGDIRDVLVSEKKRKDRKRAGRRGAVAGGVVGALAPVVSVATRSAMRNGPDIIEMKAKHPKLANKMLRNLTPHVIKKGAAGLVAGGAAGAGISAFRNRKKKIAESVLEEVKARIASKKLEEGIGSTAAGLLAKVKGLKAIKQAGNVAKDLKDTAGAIGPRQKLYKGIGKTKFGALKANTGAVGRGVANTAKTNPYGAALVGGGGLGTAGLAAWGLKKPKKVQEGVAFDFSKLKDKKGNGKDEGKDEGKGKGSEALAKAKKKVKGKKGGIPPQFVKGGDKGTPAEGGKKELPAFLKK
jgi:hypothetical protein